MTTQDFLRDFLTLRERKATLEADLKTVNQQLEFLEQTLIDLFSADNMQRVRMQNKTIYVHRQLWARPADKDMPRLVRALKTYGWDSMVQESVNTQSLSAWVRELAKTAGGLKTPDEIIRAGLLPSAVTDALAITEDFELRVRKGD